MSEQLLGEIRLFPFDFVPSGWLPCDGTERDAGQFNDLYRVIGNAFGGNESTFILPDLRSRFPRGVDPEGVRIPGDRLGHASGVEQVVLTAKDLPKHRHRIRTSTTSTTDNPAKMMPAQTESPMRPYIPAPPDPAAKLSERALEPYGEPEVVHDVMPPYLPLRFCISARGDDPRQRSRGGDAMLAEVRMFATTEALYGWAPCDGSLLEIGDYQALYSLIGDQFGGDGRSTFALPDLRGRIPFHLHAQGGRAPSGGEAMHGVTEGQWPAHSHQMRASSKLAENSAARGGTWAVARGAPSNPVGPRKAYGSQAGTSTLHPDTVSLTGDGGLHTNLPPSVSLGFFIAVRAVFPSMP